MVDLSENKDLLEEIVDESIKVVEDDFLFIEKDDGVLELLSMDKMIKPHIQLCGACQLTDCPKKGEPKDACVFEKDFVITIIKTLREEGIDVEGLDRLLIFPLIQNYLRMRRMYILETSEKFLNLFNTKDGQNKAREFYKVLKDSENTYIRALKELLATRKEKKAKVSKKQQEERNLFLAHRKNMPKTSR